MPFKVGDVVRRKPSMTVPNPKRSGEVTKVFDWGDVKVRWRRHPDGKDSRENTTTYEEHLCLELEPKEKHTIVIEVAGGVVQNVMELPDGWDYEVVDYDDQHRYYSD